MDSTRRKSRSSKRLSSASTASTAEAELSRSAYVLQQTKSRTAQLETHQEHVSSETTSAVNDHGKRIIKTTTITESVSRKAKYGRNSENCAYVEDDWELQVNKMEQKYLEE
ncbi:hypothetical protein CAPTEDRAFT_197745 [Capitella teleta]|uniref:Uncharacterized protein n=1 Tax=Capitella teleta TaxID=283909 RepID=R7T954_CAPTE|nr:hypothetical protein CAPTEDRAFT_197745 [Capitella teleta]|eukprot:ELT90229.1 hypothetical protein CAPTEDRAFT_197745 [Capitella teleta]